MAKFCTQCGNPVEEGAAFCTRCGHKFDAPTQPAAPAQQPYQQQPYQQQPYQQQPNQQQPYQQQPYQQQPYQQQPNQQQPYQQQPYQQQPNQQQPYQQQPYQQQPNQQQPYQQQPYQQPYFQPAPPVKKKSRYPRIIAAIAAVLAIVLVVQLVWHPFGGTRGHIGTELDTQFTKLCDLTTLGTQSYSYARLLTEQLLETDLASADPTDTNKLFDQCLSAWDATKNVITELAALSGDLASNDDLNSESSSGSRVLATYAPADLVDSLIPFTLTAHAASYMDEVSTQMEEVSSPAESAERCQVLGSQLIEDAQIGYDTVENLRSVYNGRTTPVQEWNNAVTTAASAFHTRFYVSGEITSGAFTSIPNGTYSVRTLSRTVKDGTIGISNTNILVDVGRDGSVFVVGSTDGLTVTSDQFPGYTPGDDNQTISINTYPANPNEHNVTFHSTSVFSWFKLDRVGGFTISRSPKDTGSAADPPSVIIPPGLVPTDGGRGSIDEIIPPVNPEDITRTLGRITGDGNPTSPPSSTTPPPVSPDDINNAISNLGAGVGPITVTLAWRTDDDLDLHVITPDESRIYYGHKTAQGGTLDVDMNAGHGLDGRDIAVENIFFPDPENGHYKIYLRNYCDRTSGTSTHWTIKVKIGDREQIFEGDIDNSGTEQFVFEFDYDQHGTNSVLPGDPTNTDLIGTLTARGARTGKITVSLMWNRFDDVDLHMTTPDGSHIYYSNKTAGGGVLDVDANAGGQRILDPVENIFFGSPQNGHYTVYLNQFSDRSDDSASYLVRVDVDGEVREFRGTIDGTGTNIPIYEFDYNGAEEGTVSGEFNGHRYVFYPGDDITWTEARSMCQSMGGHLVTITSAEEQAYIESLFPNTRGWIGAYGDGNGWSWVTGETWSYTNWASGQPDNSGGTEWCGHMWEGMRWNDLDNDDQRFRNQSGFYCEFDNYGDCTPVIPDPSDYSRPTSVTGSDITNATNELGAGVGAITVTLAWRTDDDLDLHVITPDGSEIYYNNSSAQGGELDVDMNANEGLGSKEIAIENIYFPTPENGHYKVFLENYHDRTSGTSTHWTAKIKIGNDETLFEGDIDGEDTQQIIHEFDYNGNTGTTPASSDPPLDIERERAARGAGDGKLTITLMWDSGDDLDLHVFTPDGSELYYDNRSAQGGTLDIDSNSKEEDIVSNPIENVYFPEPVSGNYWIYIGKYTDRTPGRSTNWKVRVQVGNEVENYSGTIADGEESIEVLGFRYDAPGGAG